MQFNLFKNIFLCVMSFAMMSYILHVIKSQHYFLMMQRLNVL